MSRILIKDSDILQGDTINHGDILIIDGKIAAIGVNLDANADEIIDGHHLTALPGLFDMHVHLRDPGQTHKEDIITGASAALAGGITGLACMPNTTPPVDNPELVHYIYDKSANTGVDIHPIGCITKGMHGEELCDIAALKEAGVCAITDDGRPVESAGLMEDALVEAYAQNLPVVSHCEDFSIIRGGIVNKGVASETLDVLGMDRASEDTITAREILLAAATNTRIHICHVSTKGSVDFIRYAKSVGIAVTCETCPHYFLMTEELVLSGDADYRMNPPLRTEEDRKAILKGVLDGTIDCIVTDHAPHAPEEKADFRTAPNGVIGMETSLAASLKLVHASLLTLPQLCRLMADNPRKILQLPQVKIAAGQEANMTLVDLDYPWVVDPEKLHSKARNAIWKGRQLQGKPVITITDGIIRYRDAAYFAKGGK